MYNLFRFVLAITCLSLAIATSSIALCAAFFFISLDMYLSIVESLKENVTEDDITTTHGFGQ